MLTVTPNIIQVETTDSGVNAIVTPNPIAVTVDKGNVTYNITGGGQVYGEIPNGTIDGSNATFTTDFDFVPESVQMFINGVNQYSPTHFTTTGTLTIILTTSPIVGDILTVNYTKS